jgi:biopolymer transport protein ExbD
MTGAAGGKYALRQNATINVTPFVDVMLVLLIIFMVAAPLPTVSIDTDIPPPSPPHANDLPPAVVSLQHGGAIFIDGQPTSLTALLADAAAHTQGGHRLVLRSDRDVPYRQVVAVLNELQLGGFKKVALVSEPL